VNSTRANINHFNLKRISSSRFEAVRTGKFRMAGALTGGFSHGRRFSNRACGGTGHRTFSPPQGLTKAKFGTLFPGGQSSAGCVSRRWSRPF
jgi:hypothetical protein